MGARERLVCESERIIRECRKGREKILEEVIPHRLSRAWMDVSSF